jgi:uncharacterized protein YciI
MRNHSEKRENMWIIKLNYKRPLLEVDHWLGEHRKFLDECYSKKLFIASGPRNPRTGGVILARMMPREELNSLLDQDPFIREGIAEFELLEFQVTKGNPSLLEI